MSLEVLQSSSVTTWELYLIPRPPRCMAVPVVASCICRQLRHEVLVDVQVAAVEADEVLLTSMSVTSNCYMLMQLKPSRPRRPWFLLLMLRWRLLPGDPGCSSTRSLPRELEVIMNTTQMTP